MAEPKPQRARRPRNVLLTPQAPTAVDGLQFYHPRLPEFGRSPQPPTASPTPLQEYAALRSAVEKRALDAQLPRFEGYAFVQGAPAVRLAVLRQWKQTAHPRALTNAEQAEVTQLAATLAGEAPVSPNMQRLSSPTTK